MKTWHPDSSLPTPLYHQFREHLRVAIGNQESDLVVDGKLMPEEDLAKRFKVARTTVRRAILELVSDGLLTRSRGKGTFVIYDRPFVQQLDFLQSFGELLQSSGAVVGGVVLSEGLITLPSGTISGFFHESTVYMLERVRTANGIPVSCDRSFFSSRLAPWLEQWDLRLENIWRRLENEAGVHVGYADDGIRAVAAGPEVARNLDIKTSSPLLMLERAIYDDVDSPLEYTFSFYRPDQFQYQIRHHRMAGRALVRHAFNPGGIE